MTINDNIEDIVKEWLWSYLANKANFETHNDIFPQKIEHKVGSKDFITFYLTDFRYRTLVSDVKVNAVNTNIAEVQSCTLSILYNGKQAYKKLNHIAGLIRSSDAASEFLDGYNVNSAILSLVDVSSLIGDNNIQESANLDVVLSFSTENAKDTPADGYIESADLEDIQLFN